MKGALHYLTAGVVAYLLMLGATLPAPHLYAWFGDHLPRLTLHHPTGTLWSGDAEGAVVDHITLPRLHWSFAPAALLHGRIAFDTTLEGGDRQARGRIAVARGSTIELEGVVAHAAIEALPLPLLLAGSRPEGVVGLDLDTLQIEAHRLTALSGEISWRGAAIRLAERIELGGFGGRVSYNAGTITIAIHDLDGDLKLDLAFTLNRDLAYTLRGSARLRDPARHDLGQLLQLLDGSTTQAKLDYRGRLPALPIEF